MCMLPRDNIRKTSYLKGYVQIEGDSSLINSIEHEVRDYISIGKDLYETQEQLTLRTAKAVGFLLLPLLH